MRMKSSPSTSIHPLLSSRSVLPSARISYNNSRRVITVVTAHEGDEAGRHNADGEIDMVEEFKQPPLEQTVQDMDKKYGPYCFSLLKEKLFRGTPTLPRLPKMPFNLCGIRRTLYSFLVAGRKPTATTAGRAAAPSAGASSAGGGACPKPRHSSSSKSQGERGTSLAAGFQGGAGVMERPVTDQGEEDIVSRRGTLTRPQGRKNTQDPSDSWVTSKVSGSRRSQQINKRRSFLRNFWYAAALSQDLKSGKPKEVKMLGRTVVLFRDGTGVAHAMDNVCPHRGAPLGKGWQKQVPDADTSHTHSCVVCPYHGWAFDAKGKVREVPSCSDQDHLPKRQLVETYLVEELGGFVWLFFGSKNLRPEERPPIPYIPELNDPDWQAVYGELEFDAPWWSVFDNAIDMSHIHYLHSDSFGNQDQPEIQDMQVEQYTYHASGTFRIHNKPVNPLWNWTAVDSVPVSFSAFLPSTSAVTITLARGVQMITFVNTVPIDENKSMNRFCLIRNFASWSRFDIFARRAMFKILKEDKVMVDVCTPEAAHTEVSLEADLPQVAFRRLRQDWVNMGYAVPPEATQGYDGSLSLDSDNWQQ